MQKYIEGFNANDYESSCESTDPSVIKYVRDYYDKHLPVDAFAWMRVNEPDKNLIYVGGFYNQFRFVIDTLGDLLTSTFKELLDNLPLFKIDKITCISD